MFLLFLSCGGENKGTAVKRAQFFPNAPLEEGQAPAEAANSDSMSAGTTIEVTTIEVFDSGTTPAGAVIPVRIEDSVRGANGKVAIPGGSYGLISVLNGGKEGNDPFARLALYQITVESRSYLLLHGAKQLAVEDFKAEGAKGQGLRSIHFEAGSRLKFRLSETVELKR